MCYATSDNLNIVKAFNLKIHLKSFWTSDFMQMPEEIGKSLKEASFGQNIGLCFLFK